MPLEPGVAHLGDDARARRRVDGPARLPLDDAAHDLVPDDALARARVGDDDLEDEEVSAGERLPVLEGELLEGDEPGGELGGARALRDLLERLLELGPDVGDRPEEVSEDVLLRALDLLPARRARAGEVLPPRLLALGDVR